ncbi:hypothetical protein KGA65_18870 [Ideonella sp. B7]|uniref:hypothetical protein n=1 Tax=Ideonella benzenivorans TaxID=2831643 RepID=UPI001CEC98D3|nr:hypothetical protein [Ideonella benzenivorans]MCA6218607.1 hypothetical protein [Ideonella benzenivorans]
MTVATTGTLGVDFDDAVLGLGLPPLAEAALREAGEHRSDAPRSMAALMRAQALAPEHPAVLIAFYRHHFYGHRLGPARDVARRALVAGARALGLPACWRDVPRQALAGARDEPITRFYLFTLKGYAYLSLRLGDETEARDALALLRHLDPDDRVGGALVEAVRQRALVGEDEDAPSAPPAFGAAAWARLAPQRPSGVHPAAPA